MMNADWQIGFRVKGLIAPLEDTAFNDRLLIRGIYPGDDSYVFFKVRIEETDDRDKIKDGLVDNLRGITQVYSLITNRHTEILTSSVMAKISSESPFGHTKYPPDSLKLMAVPTEMQRRESIPLLNLSIDKHEFMEELYKDRKKQFLKTAIDYYNRSLGDLNLEEKLIDLMICLESLFSLETQELRLRYSLRVSQLLGAEKEEEIPTIFKTIYDLYKKRNLVVHGTNRVKLDEKKVMALQGYLKKTIRWFLHIEIEKRDVLKLLDECVYDQEKRVKLKAVVSEAIAKW